MYIAFVSIVEFISHCSGCKKVMREVKTEQWGIASFDTSYKGLPRSVFNLLKTCSKATQLTAVGHFISEGLASGQRVVLVGFENAAPLFNSLGFCGFSFEEALNDERLVYLYYKPSFSQQLSFTVDYKKVFNEIINISNVAGVGVDRIVFLHADTLFNLQSRLLAQSSAERVLSSVAEMDVCMLGVFQSLPGAVQEHLDSVAGVLGSYFEIKPGDQGAGNYDFISYRFHLPCDGGNGRLFLSKSLGFNAGYDEERLAS